MADGLSNSNIKTIGQDKYGFIWVGTRSGLNIYDGSRFKQYFYNARNEESLVGNSITDFIFDSDSVWIATRSGLCKMDIKTKKCRRLELGENNDVRTLLLEKDKNTLWVGTETGLLKLNTQTSQFSEFNTNNSSISNNTVRAIYKDSDNNLWVGTFDQLNLLTTQTQVFTPINLKAVQNTNISYNFILSISPQSTENDSCLWVGTETGLMLYNRFSGEKKLFNEENSGLANSVIKTIHYSGAERVWLGTDFGLAEMNEDFLIKPHFHNLNSNNSLANNIVWDIFEDNAGTLWFGTNNGISILSNSNERFRFYPITYEFENNILGYEIRDILETKAGDLWIASPNGAIKYDKEGVFCEILNSSQVGSRKLVDDNTTRLFEDIKGNIWIASNGGLSIWNEKEEKLTNYSAGSSSAKGLRSNFFESFFLLEDGTILINTQAGLHKVLETKNGIEFEFIRRIQFFTELLKNNLWSFVDNKLYCTNTLSFKQELITSFNEQGNNLQLTSLLDTDNDMVWIGSNSGLIRYNIKTKEYDYYQIRSDKNYPLVNLLEDTEGNIWASSYSAILKFSIETMTFEIYPSGDEIPINSFERNCKVLARNGDMIFGGQDGYIRFSPENITKSEFVSPVLLTKLIISNQEIEPQKIYDGKKILKTDITFCSDIILDYSSKSFSIEYSSMHFGNRDGTRYAHILEGNDLDWLYSNGPSGNASYSNLKPGNYTLKVKGTNGDGVWNEKETILHIKIKPPFWANPYVVTLYLLALFLLVMGMVFYYKNRTKMQNLLKIAFLEKEHEHELSITKQKFFTNISHEFRAPLSLIIGPAEKLINQNELSDTSKNYTRIIENNARRLMWLNDQILDFRKLEMKAMLLKVSEFNLIEFVRNVYELFKDKAERKNLEYEFQTDFEQLDVFMDIRKVETILFNLLSNAFKFTPKNGKIHVKLSRADFTNASNKLAGIMISVSDTGIGIAKEEQSKIFERFYQTKESEKMERGSGIGLTLVSEYVRMHKGEITLESEVGKGAEFKILFPLFSETEMQEYLVSENQETQPLLKPDIKIDSGISYHNTGVPNILLVEDDHEIADFISIGFKNKFNVSVAVNGKDALNFILNEIPDLVICDINMPEMDGIEFTKRFRNNPKTAHIPLIILTGQTQRETQLEVLECGADAYMVKPFDIDLLEVRVCNQLKRQEVLSSFLKVKDIAKPKDKQITSQDEKLLEKVVASIEKFISDPDLKIEKVCDDTGYSHSMLYRKIKVLTGQTLNEFIRTIRVQRAEQLLRTKKFNMAEVRYETGFTNHSYFSKAFKKHYKVSPKEYVNRL